MTKLSDLILDRYGRTTIGSDGSVFIYQAKGVTPEGNVTFHNTSEDTTYNLHYEDRDGGDWETMGTVVKTGDFRLIPISEANFGPAPGKNMFRFFNGQVSVFNPIGGVADTPATEEDKAGIEQRRQDLAPYEPPPPPPPPVDWTWLYIVAGSIALIVAIVIVYKLLRNREVLASYSLSSPSLSQ